MGQNDAGLVMTGNLKEFLTAAHYLPKRWTNGTK